MLASDALRLVLVTVVLTSWTSRSIQMWMLDGFALLFGLAACVFLSGPTCSHPAIARGG